MIRKCEYVPTLETERLILRELNPADADDLQEWFCLKEIVAAIWKVTESE